MSSRNKEEQYGQSKQKPHPMWQETFQEGWQHPPHLFQELPHSLQSTERGEPPFVLGMLFIHRVLSSRDNQEGRGGWEQSCLIFIALQEVSEDAGDGRA